MDDTRAALERGLAADPDNVAAHAAYADYLIEHDDPRGEFIRLQLALEDGELPAEQRRAAEIQAFELLDRNAAEWLGPLSEFARTYSVRINYRRGWVHTLRVRHNFIAIVEAIRPCRLVRLTAELEVEYSNLTHRVIEVLPNLRRLTLLTGPDYEAENASGWMHAVRTHVGFERMGIDTLARLKHLVIHTRDFADAGVEFLIESGVLDRLTGLDLSDCAVTDDGAQLLADCPATARLEYLTLEGNHLSPIGIDALAAAGVVVSQRQRLGPQSADEPYDDDGEIAF